MKEQNFVRTFDKNGRMLYEEEYHTAEAAYDAYRDFIRILKKGTIKEEITVVRFRFGKVMTMETLFSGC